MIQTVYGKIEGIDCGSYIQYRGIPYAKAPVEDLRWKAPQKTDPWEGILKADSFRHKCMQESLPSELYDKEFYDDPAFDAEMSEDCLYLHIWVPKNAQNCPVAFWIHGGAFMGGYSFEKEFDGEAYCKRGVIFVSVEYRCNIFGYLAHPWLSEESGVSGNYGTLDQIAALEWVYENIEAFGGDPNNITVFGQSAGAMSTQTLISSKLTEGKIAKVIMQSGGTYGCGLHRDISLTEQEEYGVLFSDTLGVRNLSEMRSIPAEQIVAMTGAFFEKAMPKAHGLFLTPTMDGRVLEGGYYELMDRGRIHDIPVMLGSVKDDILTGENTKKPDDSPLYAGSIAFSHKLEELGRRPAYVYYFKRDLPGDHLGAWHSCELWYMMGTMQRCWRPWTEADLSLSEQMLDYWTQFMKTGDPNRCGLPVWQPCSKNHAYIKELDI